MRNPTVFSLMVLRLGQSAAYQIPAHHVAPSPMGAMPFRPGATVGTNPQPAHARAGQGDSGTLTADQIPNLQGLLTAATASSTVIT